jgi:hypothetical protein
MSSSRLSIDDRIANMLEVIAMIERRGGVHRVHPHPVHRHSRWSMKQLKQWNLIWTNLEMVLSCPEAMTSFHSDHSEELGSCHAACVRRHY